MSLRPSLAHSLARLRHVCLSSSGAIQFRRPFSSALNTNNTNKPGKAQAGEEMSVFPGAPSPYTTEMEFKSTFTLFPCFRVTDQIGNFLMQPKVPIPDDKLVEIYRCMVSLRVMDMEFYDAQRQGRLSFYMTSFGEEATVIGASAALQPDDEMFSQYRECGALMWRGFSYDQFANQCVGSDLDLGKGRQMPIHYGSRELHYQTVSSPLATQLPHAAGAAYAFKREGSDRIAACFFGEGAASEGDFHAAMNFASTLKCPVMFICRNNGYAISTPAREQFSGDGIASRGIGYGIRTTRVDGLDIHAVYEAVAEGRRLCRENNEPVLIECMSYRAGHHSTSDDSLRYRKKEEVQFWADRNPIDRLRLTLESKGLWDSHQESTLWESKRQELRRALTDAEKRRRPPIDQMFRDVYTDIPPHLLEQSQEMMDHIQRHPKDYKLEEFSS